MCTLLSLIFFRKYYTIHNKNRCKKFTFKSRDADDAYPFVVRVLTMPSAQTCDGYTVTLVFDKNELADSHCKCESGVRALACAHVAAVLISLSHEQGVPASSRGQRSLDAYDSSVWVPSS